MYCEEDDCSDRDDDDIPQEVEDAYKAHAEAYATWHDARKEMNELARARGFYVVTLWSR